LFVILAFGAADALASLPGRRVISAGGGMVAIVACVWLTSIQLQYWRSSRTLWEHTINVTRDNSLAYFNLGAALEDEAKMDEAVSQLSEAIRLKPDYPIAHNSLATVLGAQGKVDEALIELNEAVRLDPGYSEAQGNLGIVLAKKGKTSDAIVHLSEALRIN